MSLNPYAIYGKLALVGVGLLAFIFLAMSWMSRGQEIARLTDWQNAVVISTTDATVQADAKGVRKTLKPEQVPAAIASLKRSLDGSLAALDGFNRSTLDAKARADNADHALATATVVFEQRYSSAEKRIAALDSRPAAVDPAQQCVNIGTDSKAPWEGWR